jgi:hypothetical protein
VPYCNGIMKSVMDSLYLKQAFLSEATSSRLHSGVSETFYINHNETQEPLEPWTSSDALTHEDSSPNWGAGMAETSSNISLTDQNHTNNW